MLLYPDINFLMDLILKHPFYFILFLIIFATPSVLYLRIIISSGMSQSSKTIYCLILFFVLVQQIMISILLLFCDIIREKFMKKEIKVEQLNIYFKTFIMIIMGTIIWFLFIILVLPDSFLTQRDLTYYKLLKIFLSYPAFYDNIIRPAIFQNIFHIVILGLTGIIFFLFYPPITPENNTIITSLFLLFMIIVIISFAKTKYHHIRYLYFILPLVLIYCAHAILSISHIAKKYLISKLIFIFVITGFLLHQILFIFNIINAETGSPMPPITASHPLFHVDYKTCGTYLRKNRGYGDYVIAFASAHQAAVYSGKIDACFRAELEEHQGPTHFRTGSLYIDRKEELIAITENFDKNVWFIYSKNSFAPNTWQHKLINSLQEYIVCEANDNNTSLIKVQSQTLVQIAKQTI